MNVVCFETEQFNHRNRLIYILTHMEVANNNYLAQGIVLPLIR